MAIGGTERSGPNSPEFVDFGGVKNLTNAARAAGVRQIVLESSMGVGSGGGLLGMFLNLLSGDALKWKAQGEAYLRSSGVPYTIIRPGGLTNDPAGQVGIVFQQGDQGSGRIGRGDVAAVMIAALDNPAALGKTFEVFSDPRPGPTPGAVASADCGQIPAEQHTAAQPLSARQPVPDDRPGFHVGVLQHQVAEARKVRDLVPVRHALLRNDHPVVAGQGVHGAGPHAT